jgi:hypothetical protein
VIIATGAEYRKPALDNLSEFEAAGVYYAATAMEAQLCVGEEVVVIGGGNSVGQAAVFLAQTAVRVHILVGRRGWRTPCRVISFASGASAVRTVMSDQNCAHVGAITSVKQPGRYECEECVKIGSRWVHLRTCQTCGGTRCCDSSPKRHATGHAHATGHPVIASAEPGKRWLYCYPDDAFVEY